MEEAMLWNKEGKKIRCELCPFRCLISEGELGVCKVRINKKDSLYTKNFGKIVSFEISPIEKFSLYHFFPGLQTLSLTTLGTPFKGNFFLNWDIGKISKKKGKEYTPEEIVRMVNKKGLRIITFTHEEPTIFFEFAYRLARIAKRYNIKVVFVTNGYITSDAIKKIGKYLDAVVVDFKASGDPRFYKKYLDVSDVEPIFGALKNFRKHRVFIEVSNLIIPGIGDDENYHHTLVEWLINELDSSIPYHLLRFTPFGILKNTPSTSQKTLEAFAIEAKKMGLRFPYVHDFWGSEYENTYCYNCRSPVITRTGSFVNEIILENKRCPHCGFKINLVSD